MCGISTRSGSAAMTIAASGINNATMVQSGTLGQYDSGMFYQKSNGQGFMLGPWSALGGGLCL